MSNIFSAEAVLKDLSRLKDKIETTVASSLVTIIDDPHLEDGMGSSSFDGVKVSQPLKKKSLQMAF